MSRLVSWEARIRAATGTDSSSLAIYRIIFGIWSLLVFSSWTWLAEVPSTFFSPPYLSVANLFERMPPKGFFVALNVLNALFIVTLTIGLRTRASTIGLLLVVLVGRSFHFSLGKIDHSILEVCVLFAMIFSDWGAKWSVDDRLKKRSAPASGDLNSLAILAMLIAFGFFTAGFGKALAWLDFNTDTGGFLSWVLMQSYGASRSLLLAPWIAHMPWPRLYELVDIVAVIFEIGFLWAIWKRRRWQLWIMFWCIFHLANTLVLNIAFFTNLIVVMAFVPWSEFVGRDHRRSWVSTFGMAVLFVSILFVSFLRQQLSVSLADWSGEELTLAFQGCAWAGLFFVFLGLPSSKVTSTSTPEMDA